MYYSVIRVTFLAVLIFCISFSLAIAAGLSADSEGVLQESETILTGNFSGYVTMEDGERKKFGLIVTDQGDNIFHAVLHYGGLPWEQEDEENGRTVELHGTYTDYTLRLTGDFSWDLQFILNRYTALDDRNNYKGHLERVIRLEPNS